MDLHQFTDFINLERQVRILKEEVTEIVLEKREMEKENCQLKALALDHTLKIQSMENQLARIGFQSWAVPIDGKLINEMMEYIKQHRAGGLGRFAKEDVDALIKKIVMAVEEKDDEWIEEDQPIEEEQLAIEQPEVVQPAQQLYPPLPPMLPLNEVQNFAPARGGGRGGGIRGGGIRGGFRGAGRGGRNTGRGGGGGGRGGRNGGRGGGNRCPIV